MVPLIRKIQISIPFRILYGSYLERFLAQGFNPEIGFDSEALDRCSARDFRNAAEKLHEHGLAVTLHAPFMDLAPGASDPQIWKVTKRRLEQMLGLVSVFRAKTVVCHADYDENRYWYRKEAWVRNSLKLWSWFGRNVMDEGARLMLENVYEWGPDDILVLFEGLRDSGTGFCLDTGHQEAFSRSSLTQWIETLGSFLGQLHLHDNSGRQDEHLGIGKGVIDFPSLFRQLKLIKKEPPVITLESHKESDLWPSIRYLERIWPWQ